nr:MAG TPA: ATP synthase B chain-like protein [Caudoviricetes sp.]
MCEKNFYSKAGSTGPYDLICFFLFSSSGKAGGFGLLLLQTLEQRVSERLEKECDFKIKIKRTCKNGK